MEESEALIRIIKAAIRRQGLTSSLEAYRLFNGFYEGVPGLVLDRYASALIIFDHTDEGVSQDLLQSICDWSLENLDNLESILFKRRRSPSNGVKNGLLIHGLAVPEKITELGVTYALNLQLNQDASFYIDTRHLRQWLLEHSLGWRVLNTFAYTGSLGVAAGAGGAQQVVQTDLNSRFLDMAKQSCKMNDLSPEKCKILAGDFFRVVGRMRHNKRLFDCAILDPPYFSVTGAGRVDLLGETTRLLNKIRPLVAHEGWLVVINNALFLPGKDFMDELKELCKSPYLSFMGKIDVPLDVTGYPETIVESPPVDPAPFNHPTKIALLNVLRKDQQK